MAKWGTVRIPDALLSEIDQYLDTVSAEKHGYTNIAQFVTQSVRKNLDQLVDTDYHIVLKNKKYNQVLDLSIRERGKTIFCKICDTDDCEHTDIAKNDPEVRIILLKNKKEIATQKRR